MNKITPQLVHKAKQAKNPQELKAIAIAEGLDLTDLAAKNLYQQLHVEQVIADEELEAVAGGGCGSNNKNNKDCGTLMKDGCPTFWDMFG